MTGIMLMGGRFPTFLPDSARVLSTGARVGEHVAAGAILLARFCPEKSAT
ncbi:MAG TPA: hypothetical protein VFV13_10880 [Acidimicrobiia bacterium]|nr:hypothetical protein [Acidimicrobiia bacterium]